MTNQLVDLGDRTTVSSNERVLGIRIKLRLPNIPSLKVGYFAT
jgi:hypothetical protein